MNTITFSRAIGRNSVGPLTVEWEDEWPPPDKLSLAVGVVSGLFAVVDERTIDDGLRQEMSEAKTLGVIHYRLLSCDGARAAYVLDP